MVLMTCIGEVGSDVIVLWQDLSNAIKCVTDADSRIGELGEVVRDLQSEVGKLSSSTTTLWARVEDEEVRACCNNFS